MEGVVIPSRSPRGRTRRGARARPRAPTMPPPHGARPRCRGARAALDRRGARRRSRPAPPATARATGTRHRPRDRAAPRIHRDPARRPRGPRLPLRRARGPGSRCATRSRRDRRRRTRRRGRRRRAGPRTERGPRHPPSRAATRRSASSGPAPANTSTLSDRADARSSAIRSSTRFSTARRDADKRSGTPLGTARRWRPRAASPTVSDGSNGAGTTRTAFASPAARSSPASSSLGRDREVGRRDDGADVGADERARDRRGQTGVVRVLVEPRVHRDDERDPSSDRAAASAAHDAPKTEWACSRSTRSERSFSGSRGPKSARRWPWGVPGMWMSGSATSTSPCGPTTVTSSPASRSASRCRLTATVTPDTYGRATSVRKAMCTGRA